MSAIGHGRHPCAVRPAPAGGWARSTMRTGRPMSSQQTSPPEPQQVRAQHQRGRLADGHEVAGRVRVRDGNGLAALQAPRHQFDARCRCCPGRCRTARRPAGIRRRSCASVTSSARRLRRAHHAARVHRLVGRDQHEPRADVPRRAEPWHACRARSPARRHRRRARASSRACRPPRGRRRGGCAASQAVRMTRGRVMSPSTARPGPVGQRATEVALDVEEVVLRLIDQRERLEARSAASCRTSSDPDRAAGPGDEHPPAGVRGALGAGQLVGTTSGPSGPAWTLGSVMSIIVSRPVASTAPLCGARAADRRRPAAAMIAESGAGLGAVVDLLEHPAHERQVVGRVDRQAQVGPPQVARAPARRPVRNARGMSA